MIAELYKKTNEDLILSRRSPLEFWAALVEKEVRGGSSQQAVPLPQIAAAFVVLDARYDGNLNALTKEYIETVAHVCVPIHPSGTLPQSNHLAERAAHLAWMLRALYTADPSSFNMQQYSIDVQLPLPASGSVNQWEDVAACLAPLPTHLREQLCCQMAETLLVRNLGPTTRQMTPFGMQCLTEALDLHDDNNTQVQKSKIFVTTLVGSGWAATFEEPTKSELIRFVVQKIVSASLKEATISSAGITGAAALLQLVGHFTLGVVRKLCNISSATSGIFSLFLLEELVRGLKDTFHTALDGALMQPMDSSGTNETASSQRVVEDLLDASFVEIFAAGLDSWVRCGTLLNTLAGCQMEHFWRVVVHCVASASNQDPDGWEYAVTERLVRRILQEFFLDSSEGDERRKKVWSREAGLLARISSSFVSPAAVHRLTRILKEGQRWLAFSKATNQSSTFVEHLGYNGRLLACSEALWLGVGNEATVPAARAPATPAVNVNTDPSEFPWTIPPEIFDGVMKPVSAFFATSIALECGSAVVGHRKLQWVVPLFTVVVGVETMNKASFEIEVSLLQFAVLKQLLNQRMSMDELVSTLHVSKTTLPALAAAVASLVVAGFVFQKSGNKFLFSVSGPGSSVFDGASFSDEKVKVKCGIGARRGQQKVAAKSELAKVEAAIVRLMKSQSAPCSSQFITQAVFSSVAFSNDGGSATPSCGPREASLVQRALKSLHAKDYVKAIDEDTWRYIP